MLGRFLQRLFGQQKDADSERRVAYKVWQKQQNAERVLHLARVISGADPAVMVPVELSIRDPGAFLETHGHEHPNPKSGADVIPFWAAWNALLHANYLGSIDWKSDADELIDSLNPVLLQRGIGDFDWTFINDLTSEENWDALRNENLLPLIATRLAARPFVFTSIDAGGDSYDFAVLTPGDFAKIDGLKGTDFEIRKFS